MKAQKSPTQQTLSRAGTRGLGERPQGRLGPVRVWGSCGRLSAFACGVGSHPLFWHAICVAFRARPKCAPSQSLNLQLPKLWQLLRPVRYARLRYAESRRRCDRPAEMKEHILFTHRLIIAGPM